MKNQYSINRKLFKTILSVGLIFLNIRYLQAIQLNNEIFSIYSNYQRINIYKNIIIYTGNVKININHTTINSDSIIFLQSFLQNKKKNIEGYGKNIKFYYYFFNNNKKNKLFTGTADFIYYTNNHITITGNVHIKYFDVSIKTNCMTFYTK